MTKDDYLRQILEISYEGRVDGRAARLEMIERYARAALAVRECTSDCFDNYCPIHGIESEKEKR